MIETGKDKVRMRILKSAVRCVDVPNEAAREALAAQRAAEAEKLAKERAAKEEAERQARLQNVKGAKGKKATEPTTEATEDATSEATEETTEE